MNARGALAAAAAAAGLYAGLVRPRMKNWGATSRERDETLPGDGVVPDAHGRSTMAVTIDAPPADVWPWLVQMGHTRAGWYSWDHLDNAGHPSATTIHPEWQDVAAGDRLISTPNQQAWFDVVEIEPERTLVLRGRIDMLHGRSIGLDGPLPSGCVDGTWAFFLEPQNGGTRLVARGQGTGNPRLFADVMNWIFWEPAHWIMQTRQFANLRRLVEETPESSGS
jgi:uncharacterized protein YndB with AHSA1/START domain